jgi:hypothetical protein
MSFSSNWSYDFNVEDLKDRVESTVNMSQYEIDYLMMKAYRIGSLLCIWQPKLIIRFYLKQEFNAEEKKKWDSFRFR